MLHGLHQHQPHAELPLGSTGLELQVLHPQARRPILRRDDATIERDRIALLLDLGLQVRQAYLDLLIGRRIDRLVRFQDRDLFIEALDFKVQRVDLRPKSGSFGRRINEVVARLDAPELENQVDSDQRQASDGRPFSDRPAAAVKLMW